MSPRFRMSLSPRLKTNRDPWDPLAITANPLPGLHVWRVCRGSNGQAVHDYRGDVLINLPTASVPIARSAPCSAAAGVLCVLGYLNWLR